MKSITIKGSKRESVGKKSTKALRNAGQVPCVIYGGNEPVHFAADERQFNKLVYTPDVYTVIIDIDGEKYNCIKQDIQFHPVHDRILHVDFFQLFDDKAVTMNIPTRTVGSSPGVMNGGVLRMNNRRLKVRAIPANLPDVIECDISTLKIGGKIYVSDKHNDAYEILHPENEVIVMVRTSRNAVEEEEEEGAEGEAAEGAPAAEAPSEG